jgi:integrase
LADVLMQMPTIQRHHDGWRAMWRENGAQRFTPKAKTKAQAKRDAVAVLVRLEAEAGAVADSPAITFGELCERFHAQYPYSAASGERLRRQCDRLRSLFGDVPARDVSGETLLRWFNEKGYAATYRYGLLVAGRQVYNFGMRVGAVSANPLRAVSVPKSARGRVQLPFESWAEVYAVADELGKWGPMVRFAVDCGARPQELRALEHKHVVGNVVELPGVKTDHARRKVTLTEHGLAAYNEIPRRLGCPYVFHSWLGDGVPLTAAHWRSWTTNRWHPALKAAGLAARRPNEMRHTFAYFSLRASVPIVDLAHDMGHKGVQITYGTYGGWADEMGDRSAQRRGDWAKERGESVTDLVTGEA